MPYITQAEAEANVDGFTSKTQMEKDKLLLQADAYIQSKCVPVFADAAKVPNQIKQAAYEVIRGVMDGKLMTGQTQVVKSKRVKADTVEVQKEFAEGSVEMNQYEQLINMLLGAWANCGKGGVSVSLMERI